jgi:hypothetical protein
MSIALAKNLRIAHWLKFITLPNCCVQEQIDRCKGFSFELMKWQTAEKLLKDYPGMILLRDNKWCLD